MGVIKFSCHLLKGVKSEGIIVLYKTKTGSNGLL
jgi:hypothetical protein